MAKESGMNPDACASYSLADRFHCDQCGSSPDQVSVEGGKSMMRITVKCHGEKEVWQGPSSELVFSQTVFKRSDAV